MYGDRFAYPIAAKGSRDSRSARDRYCQKGHARWRQCVGRGQIVMIVEYRNRRGAARARASNDSSCETALEDTKTLFAARLTALRK